MTLPSMILPLADFVKFSPTAQLELRNYLLSQLGDIGPQAADISGRDEEGLVALSVTDAKLFLNNCSEKTVTILRYMVDHDGEFLESGISRLTGNAPDQLRGAWAGLTKRTRTITGDATAKLVNWFKLGNDDWRGVMASQTVDAMKAALSK